MPLRGTLDGEDIIASDLDDAAWRALRERRTGLRMPCFGTGGIMRVSKLGLKRFAHHRRSTAAIVCDWKRETEDHRRAKREILDACRAAGWEARPEASADDGYVEGGCLGLAADRDGHGARCFRSASERAMASRH